MTTSCDCPCADRLERQAKAIRELRRQMASVLNAVPVTDVEDTSGRKFPGTPGVYVPVGHCLICNKPGRKGYLTCKPCGSERQQQINQRALPVVPQCLNCGTPKRTNTLLCHPCTGSFKTWKRK